MNALAIREVLMDDDVPSSARLVWTYLNVAAEPQNGASLIRDLGISHGTVTKCVGDLIRRGLVRRVNGVLLPVVPQ
ncbi:helix-turn-helix domain-containing protein [Streptomyces sp. NPDC049952]|uniref:helix-turn-helix domain-containing protein n=1 Tax=Streptomyces sp. NPDC049952 TaxID=3156665 RepID=UPI00343DFA15